MFAFRLSFPLCAFLSSLFEMGFAAQLHEILKQLGDERQTSLFSATLPKQLVEFTRAGLKEPIVKIRLDVESKISPQLRMVFLTLRRDQKMAALLILLREQIHKGEQTIVFAATRHHVEYLHMMLTTADMASAPVYGQLDPAARKINIAKFRTKKCSILLVTDVAARGIDIPLLDNVINFDFPAKPKLFIHRAGRVARAGRTGVAYSFVAPDEMPYMIDLHLFFGRKLINAVPEGEAYRDEEVYYGNFPREQLEIECEAVKALRVQAQAQRQWEVSERAYQQYNKTREGASTASAQRAKALPPPALHPMFARVQSESSRSVEQYLAGIRNYKGASTIFEVKQLHIKGGAEIMKAKRGEHDYSIARKLVEEERERENQRKAEEIKVNYNKAGFKSVDKSDLPEYNHAEDDEEGAPADDEEDDDEEADADEFDADAQAEEEDEDDDEEQEQDGEENEDDEEQEDEDGEEMEDDEEAEAEQDEEDEVPSAVRSSMQRMYGANSSKKTSTTKGTKRKGAADDEDDEAAAAQSARSSSTSAAAAEKAHKTKKQRQLEKKQKLAAGGQQSSTRNGGDSDDDDDDNDDQQADDGDAPSRRRRSALVSTEGKYRDAAFFISETPGDAASERGLALDGGSGSNMRLEDMVLDTLGDDEQAFAKARAVHTWDARKKKYIRTMVGGDPFKKQRNEAGQLIRAKDQPDLYNAWKKAHKKGVASAADSMGDDGGDDGEGGGGDESEGPDRTPRGRARERRGGGTAGSARGGGRGGKSGASSRASSASSKKGGSAGGSELKSTDEIRKARAQKEKNKQKNQRGGRSGGARGSRGAGMGGSFRSSSRDGGEGRSRSRGPPRGGMSRGGRGGGGGGGGRGGGGGGRGGGGGGRGGRGGGGGGGRGGGGRGGGRGRGR